MIGPNIQLLTPLHPLDAAERRSGLESAQPIRIEDGVWLGGGVIVNPGVIIGPRSVVGSGRVVTRDVPADAFAAGNPCRVICTLPHKLKGASPGLPPDEPSGETLSQPTSGQL